MSEATQTPIWVEAFPLAELPPGQARLYKENGCQVAVFHLADGALHAVDNRCPHEGYPLNKGWVSDCIVTCPWHNFKFDLRDGQCVMGDEAVRTFPVRVDDDGLVHLDITPPDPAVERPRLWASLEQAMLRRKTGQMARDVVRLIVSGVAPARIALEAARLDAAYAEYGTTHATPVAADILRYLPRHGPAGSEHNAVLPLMQPLEMASDSHVRRPLRRTPAPEAVSRDQLRDGGAAIGERLRALVEAERAEEAEALLRGALAAGAAPAAVEAWLYRLCADHFLDFGHALIYQVKLFELLDTAGWSYAADLLPAHLFSIVTGTREDLLPEWLWFRRAWDAVADQQAALMAPNRAINSRYNPVPLAETLADSPRDKALAAIPTAIAAGAPLDRIVDAIAHAAAQRILRFDLGIDATDRVQEGWLDVTHTLTFAAAVRVALRRYRDPHTLRLLMFAARFVLSVAPLDSPPERRITTTPNSPAQHAREGTAEPSAPTAEAILQAVTARDAQRAVTLTARHLAAQPRHGADVTALRVALGDACLGDGRTRPIVVAHAIKTTVAAFDEYHAMHPDLRDAPVLAAVRLLASPIRERRLGRVTHEAVRFVIDGKVPKTLT